MARLTRDDLEAMGAHVLGTCEREAYGMPADVYWVRFMPKGEQELVEGKLYLPHDPNNELVHMSPGFPGGNAGRMEMLHAAKLVDAGYAVSTHRFNGTSLVGDDAEEVINCPERVEYAAANHETHVGGFRENGYPIAGVVRHPLSVLLTIGAAFEHIHTVGHSMGVAANNISVAGLADNHPPVGGRVRTMVGLAGYMAGPPEHVDDEWWPGLRMPMSELSAYELQRMLEKGVNFATDAATYRAAMFGIAVKNNIIRLPDYISQFMLFAANDPLIHCPEKGEDVGPIGGRKIVIRDERQPADDTKPHSMRWVKTDEIIRYLRVGITDPGLYYATKR